MTMMLLLFINSRNVKSEAIMFNSACIKMRFLAVLKMMMYSAFSVDRDMLIYLTDYQYSSLSVIFMQDLVIDLQFSISSVQLMSVKTTSFDLSKSLKRIL